jgi:PST family polysaccharide transporter
MARYLTPQDFGFLAMIATVSGIFGIFKDLGLNTALIQDTLDESKDQSTVFWAQVGLGLLFFALFCLLSPLLANFYRAPQLKLLVIGFSFTFLLDPFVLAPSTMLKKALHFKPIFQANVAGIVAGGSIGILMAAYGMGAWSLIGKTLSLSGAKAVVLWKTQSWRPSWFFSTGKLKKYLGFGTSVSLTRGLSHINRHLDDLLIGRYFGADMLGFYTQAYLLMSLPVAHISGAVSQVMFPAMSRHSHETATIREYWIKMNRYIAFLVFPIAGLTIVLAAPFIHFVLGPQWQGSVIFLQLLAFPGALQALSYAGIVFYAMGKPKAFLYLNIVATLYQTAALGIGLIWGPLGVAIGACVGIVGSAILLWWKTGVLLNLTLRQYGAVLLPYFLATLAAVAPLLLSKLFFQLEEQVITLLLFPIVFALMYVSLLYFRKDEPARFLVARVATVFSGS